MLTDVIGIAVMEDSYTLLYSFNFQPTPQGRFQLVRKLHLAFSLEDDTGTVVVDRCQLLCAWAPFFTENKYTDRAFYIKFPAREDLSLDFSDWELQDGEGVMVSQNICISLSYSFKRHRRQCLMSACSPPLTTWSAMFGQAQPCHSFVHIPEHFELIEYLKFSLYRRYL